MGTLRFWPRHRAASPPAFYEPTPYCDRLTLAEAFAEDNETRGTLEDLRGDRLLVVEAATSTIPASSRR